MQDYFLSGGLTSVEFRPPITLDGVARRGHAVVVVIDNDGVVRTESLPSELVLPAILTGSMAALFSAGMNAGELVKEITELRTELVRNNSGKAGNTAALEANQKRFDEDLYELVSDPTVTAAIGNCIHKRFIAQGIEYVAGEDIVDKAGNALDIQATKGWIDWDSVVCLPVPFDYSSIKPVNSRRRVSVAPVKVDPRIELQKRVDTLTAAYNSASGAKKASIKAELDAATVELNSFV